MAEALDCLRCCDGGWWQPWFAVAAGGAAMASSAGGNKKRGNYCPEAFFQNKIAGKVTLSLIMATSLHATRCAPCGDVAIIIGNWVAQGWGLFEGGAEVRVR